MTVLAALRVTVLLLTAPLAASAQDTVPREIWSIDGLVQLGKRSGPQPVVNQWVVVHRIASDSAGKVTGGALDSARTDRRGHFEIRYPHFGSAQATYIAITTYSGVSYISAALTRPRMSGDDAGIMVFDTTAPPYPIKVAGRHLIITSPDSSDRRRVVEVYELLNDSTLTVMGSEANPVWRAAIPRGVKDLEMNAVGDVSPSLTKVDGEWLKIFSPVSPGLRQISFTYTLGPEAFPLVMPVADTTSVFELLVQEQAAFVDGGGFTEVAGVVQEGIAFRRMLAQNVPAGATMRFAMPAPVSRIDKKAVTIVASVLAAAMLLALGFVFWRRRAPRAASRTEGAAPPNPVAALVRELATMDAEFERRTDASEAERAEFTAKRAELKARLNAALAATGQQS